MKPINSIIIIGAGQAAATAANSLRQYGYDGKITIFGNENLAPYQRPPLSKAYLMGEMPLERLQFRAPEQWEKDGVDLRINEEIIAIDRAAKTVKAKSGQSYSYDKLIIATGSRVRKIPISGANLDKIHYLKSLSDSDALGKDIESAKSIAIIGAGYIGLEVAAVARKKGLEVCVLEAAPRVLARVACEELSQFYEQIHKTAGVKIITNAKVMGFEGDGAVSGVRLESGEIIPCDVALVGIGILPNSEIAADAGIVCNNGIDTNENAQTSDEDVFACGDCANRYLETYDIRMRLESVHNAIEQGKLAAAHIMSQPMPKLETPWFWSDQYDLKLQIAGLWNSATKHILRGDIVVKKFAIFHLSDENQILSVDAINSAPEFLVGKNLIAAKAKLSPEIIADISISAKELASRALV